MKSDKPARRPRKPRARAGHDAMANTVLRQFRVIYGAVQRHLRDVERRCGISGAQAWMLSELERAPKIGVSALAERLSIHQTTCSQLVGKLVRRGLVGRSPHASDARRVGLVLTRRGSAFLRKLPRPAQGVLPVALGAMSVAELEGMQSALAHLIARLGKGRMHDGKSHLGQL